MNNPVNFSEWRKQWERKIWDEGFAAALDAMTSAIVREAASRHIRGGSIEKAVAAAVEAVKKEAGNE